MKMLSGKINLLFLIVVLSISPIQASYTAVTGCSEMMSEMVHEIQSFDENHSATESKQDCCNQNNCSSVQCTVSVIATLSSTNTTQVEYIAGNVLQIHKQLINSYFPSSIYRPPKA